MYNIRNFVSAWSEQTFEESLSTLIISPEVLTITKNCFKDLNLSDKSINGYACENLPKTEEGNTGIKITYSDVFHELLNNNSFSPTCYLVKLIELFIEKQYSLSKLNGFIARGLRTLTSLLREPDFANTLTNYLMEYDLNVETELNSTQDSSDHTDVLLRFNGAIYRLWLFQFSSRGLPHDIERITGKRGELPDGIHVLCPLHTQIAINCNKLVHSRQRVLTKLLKCEENLSTCSTKAVVKRNRLSERIENYKLSLAQCNRDISISKEVCSNELDIIEGWYFYSTSHVKRIADMILASSELIDYKQVVQILSTPEQFLSKPKIFIK